MRVILNKPILLSELASVCDAELCTDDAPIRAICTSTKELFPKDLFVALSGEKYDGEDFVEEALSRNAYVLAKGKRASLSVGCTRTALLKIANDHKRKMPLLKCTVAITGSVGKTSVKEFTKRILSEHFCVHATDKNFNNEIGVALTLLTTPKNAEILICELGMNHLGEIDTLTKAVEPDIAVITNVGNAHVGNLGSRENIAKAKLEIANSKKLFALLVPQGEQLLEGAPFRITVSTRDRSSFFFLSPTEVYEHGSRFDFYTDGKQLLSAEIKIPGRHILSSLAYAISISYMLGVSKEEILAAIEKMDQGMQRQRLLTVGRYRIYDDTYSSSPEAVVAIADMLSLGGEQCSAVLGDMLELGEKSAELHKLVGKRIYEKGFKRLYTYGDHARYIAEGAISAGMDEKNVFINSDGKNVEYTVAQIEKSYAGEILLIKGSHALGMEGIIKALK